MLKAIVEQMHARWRGSLAPCIAFRQQSGLVAFRGNITPAHPASRAITSGSSPKSSAVPLASTKSGSAERLRP